MGAGVLGLKPPFENATHPSYITWYKAMGGWQSQCIFWEEDHWECWETGQGPYRTRSDAKQEATEWAAAWGLELREGELGPEEAPDLVTNLKERFPGMTIVTLDDDTVMGFGPTVDVEADDT